MAGASACERRSRPTTFGRPALRQALAMLGLVFSCQALLGASCVDGTTPDCADAAAQCGPVDLDGSADRDASVAVPEASPDAASDAPSEADAADLDGDADLDAGDEI